MKGHKIRHLFAHLQRAKIVVYLKSSFGQKHYKGFCEQTYRCVPQIEFRLKNHYAVIPYQKYIMQ